jgi:hypothetical protein
MYLWENIDNPIARGQVDLEGEPYVGQVFEAKGRKHLVVSWGYEEQPLPQAITPKSPEPPQITLKVRSI